MFKTTTNRDAHKRPFMSKHQLVFVLISLLSTALLFSLGLNFLQWKQGQHVTEHLNESLIRQDSILAVKLEGDKEIARLKRKLIRRHKQSIRQQTPPTIETAVPVRPK